MQIPREMLCVARVLNEDDDFLTLEVGKREDVKFTLQQNEAGETVGGDQFLTLLFTRMEGGGIVVWKPWEDDGD